MCDRPSRIAHLACLSVHQSVCPFVHPESDSPVTLVQAPMWKTKNSKTQSWRERSLAQTVRCQVDGRTMCRHRTNVIFLFLWLLVLYKVWLLHALCKF